MRWVVPSEAWRDEVMLIRELYNLTFPDAWALLQKYGTAEAVFENYKCDAS